MIKFSLINGQTQQNRNRRKPPNFNTIYQCIDIYLSSSHYLSMCASVICVSLTYVPMYLSSTRLSIIHPCIICLCVSHLICTCVYVYISPIPLPSICVFMYVRVCHLPVCLASTPLSVIYL